MKNFQRGSVILLAIAVIVLLVIGGAVYMNRNDEKNNGVKKVNTTLSDIQAQKASSQAEISSNSILNLKTGDRVGNMTIMSVEKLRPERIDLPLSLNARIIFSGEVTIKGTYEYDGDNVSFTGGLVCFEPDENSVNDLPKFSDSRKTFFCFSNQTKAQQVFGPKGSSGKATVTINKYNLVYSGGSEVWNTAELINGSIIN